MLWVWLLWVNNCGAYWIQPQGLCEPYTIIYSDSGKLSTNEGLSSYADYMNCTWEIHNSLPGSKIYLSISGSSGNNLDYLKMGFNRFQYLNNYIDTRLSPLVISFTSGNDTNDTGFTIYWQSDLDNPHRPHLLNFYISTNGIYWKSPWQLFNHCCIWFGVSCSGNFTVEELILPSNNLSGFIPQDFSISTLKKLDLSFNQISGVIPPSIIHNTPQMCSLIGNSFCGSEYPPSCFTSEYAWCSNGTNYEPLKNSTHTNPYNVSSNSPYLKVLNSRESASISLKSAFIKVVISGVIADIKIVQVYVNSGNSSIDVDYYFPTSPTAVVYGIQFVINGRFFIAQLKTSGSAQEIFEISRAAGSTVAILENDAGSILKLRISNIPPQKMLRVETFYTEQLIPDEGTYQFYYPALIPPQYLYEMEGVHQDPSEFRCAFLMEITIQLPLPLSHVDCLTHDIYITTNNNTAYTQFSTTGLLSDFLLEYSMAGNDILAGLLFYEPQAKNMDDSPFDKAFYSTIQPLLFKKNFFMTIIQSPQIEDLSQFIVPREYIFILDTSASMAGRPTTIANNLMKKLLSLLNPNVDLFNIISFSGAFMIFNENSVVATQQNLSKATLYISKTTIGGFSYLLPALEKAISIPKVKNYARIITIITDGLISVQKPVLQLVKNNTQNANFYAITIGSIPNRYLTQGIAMVGGGKEFWIIDEVEEASEKFIRHVLSPVLTNITLEFNPDFGVDLSTVSSISDVMSDKPLIISGQYQGTIPDGKLLTVHGLISNGIPWTKDIYPTHLTTSSPRSLVYLWAGSRIREMEFTSNIDDIVSISLSYHVLSQYTSFIAMETGVTVPLGNAVDISSPLPYTMKAMCNCPKPDCLGKCYPSFDGSKDFCPDSGCSSNEYCLFGRCVQGNSSMCTCNGFCAPNSCNGVMCPLQCPFGSCYMGVCYNYTIHVSRDVCPIKPCPPDYYCYGASCMYYTFLKYVKPPNTTNQLHNCSSCSSTEICDYDSNQCVNVVDQDTSIDCEGQLVGYNTYICDNGNFISLSSSILTSSKFELDGIFSIEGDLYWTLPISIYLTVNSYITVAQDVSIPPTSNLIINFLNLSLDDISGITKEPDGTYSLQIIRSGNIIGQIPKIQIINNPNTNCYRLINKTGLLLSLYKCEESGATYIYSSINVIMGIVFGILGISILLGAIGSYLVFKRRRDALHELDVGI